MAAPPPPLPPEVRRLELTRGTIFPFLGGRAAWSREHLLPIFATILVGLTLIAVPLPGLKFSTDTETNEAWQVYVTLAVYIAFLVNYYINQMCGRPRSGWLLALVGLLTLLTLASGIWPAWYKLFYNALPAAQWQKSTIVPVRIAGWWFGTGLCEEGFKALPLLALTLFGAGMTALGRTTTGRLSRFLTGFGRRFGLFEPLDGIVMGVASGSGFFVAETLLQYVPGVMKQVKYPGSQAFDGLVLLLGRGLPDIAEHSAWAGLFGYFIGLAALRPGMAYVLIPFGWLSAAALHAGWDAIDTVTNNGLIILAFWASIGVLSYALLAGAIFKARDISPRRRARAAAGLRIPTRHATRSAVATVALAPADVPDGD
ncbi:MAG TPA: PrsW family glutamic-type intramembrane protease [Stellaceae bacterium]|nr:PrsW family glutamic-type intramembrane protease [Stellaceae bacterium]